MKDHEVMQVWRETLDRRRDAGTPAHQDWDGMVLDFTRTIVMREIGEVLKRVRPLADESDGLLLQAARVIEHLVDAVELEGYPFEPADVADGNDVKQKLIDHLEKYGCSSESNMPPTDMAG